MKSITSSISRGIPKGAKLICADNTGARELNLISVAGYHGTINRLPTAGIGDKITVSVRKGSPEMRRQILQAVIIRQKQPFRRPSGLRVKFEDNAAVLIDEMGEPRGTEIKGPIAREVAERFGGIASTGTTII
jgi:large subunit ribosomal protein L14